MKAAREKECFLRWCEDNFARLNELRIAEQKEQKEKHEAQQAAYFNQMMQGSAAQQNMFAQQNGIARGPCG